MAHLRSRRNDGQLTMIREHAEGEQMVRRRIGEYGEKWKTLELKSGLLPCSNRHNIKPG